MLCALFLLIWSSNLVFVWAYYDLGYGAFGYVFTKLRKHVLYKGYRSKEFFYICLIISLIGLIIYKGRKDLLLLIYIITSYI